jgi:hypothetical protein
MLKINITNLVMFILTMVKFIVAKPTMAQLVMVRLIVLN